MNASFLLAADNLTLGIFTVALSAGALAFTAAKYFFDGRIKRLDYLDATARKMQDDPLLRIAAQLLDWEVRTLEFNGKRHVFGVTMLPRALKPHRIGAQGNADVAAGSSDIVTKESFSETETLIRDAFDTLFGLLENLRYAVDLHIIQLGDIWEAPLCYYLRKLLEKDEWTSGGVREYLAAYGFPKTLDLLKCYELKFQPKFEPWAKRAAYYEHALSAHQQEEAAQQEAGEKGQPVRLLAETLAAAVRSGLAVRLTPP